MSQSPSKRVIRGVDLAHLVSSDHAQENSVYHTLHKVSERYRIPKAVRVEIDKVDREIAVGFEKNNTKFREELFEESDPVRFRKLLETYDGKRRMKYEACLCFKIRACEQIIDRLN